MRQTDPRFTPLAARQGSFHARRSVARLLGPLAAALLFGVTLGGAATASAQSVAPDASPPVPVAPAATFPLTVTDDEGTSISLAAEPQRIVSLSPSNTEILFALGAGDRIVGGTDADDYPAEAGALPDVVIQTKVQKEQIVSLQPDVILANGNGLTPQADIDQLRNLGYPVVVLTATSLDSVEKDIALIGTVTGEGASAAQTVEQMSAQVQQVEDAVASVTTTPSTFYEIGYGPDIYAPPADSPYADLITLAKGTPITGDASYTIPLEKLVQADPQVILLGDAAYGTCPGDVAARDGWKDITAVTTGAIRPVNDAVITRPGPRMPLGLVSLVRGIHPEVRLADFPVEPSFCAPAGNPSPPSSEAPPSTAP